MVFLYVRKFDNVVNEPTLSLVSNLLFFLLQSASHAAVAGSHLRTSATCFTMSAPPGKLGEKAESIAKAKLQIWLLLTISKSR